MPVQQGLDYVATWNSSMLLSDDLKEVISAQKQKRKPSFSKLLRTMKEPTEMNLLRRLKLKDVYLSKRTHKGI
nr:delta(3,5)-delta(2,4)-dienoyl-CoA isomerase, mitochondrial [Tanacetum cinerariifolium]